MLKLEELKEWFETIWNILVDINISINNIERLINRKNEEENKLRRVHGFFNYHFHQLRFIMVIQLFNLFSNKSNDKRSFYKLTNRLKNDKYDSKLKKLLFNNKLYEDTHLFKSKKDIINEVSLIDLDIQQNLYLIKKVMNIRDMAYAHKDPKVVEPIIITTKELRTLVDFAVNIYNQLSSKLFNTQAYFDTVDSWDIGNIIDQLIDYRNLTDKKKLMKISATNK